MVIVSGPKLVKRNRGFQHGYSICENLETVLTTAPPYLVGR